MRDKKLRLTQKDFKFLCPLSSDDMNKIEGGYYCDTCEKKVHNVSDMTQKEYQILLKKEKNLCVSFKSVATAGLFFSMVACSSPKKTQEQLLGKISSSQCIDNSSLKI